MIEPKSEVKVFYRSTSNSIVYPVDMLHGLFRDKGYGIRNKDDGVVSS